MDFCKKTYNTRYYSSVTDIPQLFWEKLNCSKNLYLHPKYLSAIANHHKSIQFYYLILFNNIDEPIAFATIQIVNFDIKSVQNDTLFSLEKITCLFEKLGILSAKKPVKILTLGNTFVSGEHGVFIKDTENKQTVIKELAKSVVQFTNNNNTLKKEVKAYMLKDFVKESLTITNELHEANYHSFNVDPNMTMAIDPEWLSFSDYLAAIKTKFRVKAKKALQLSKNLTTIAITEENLSEYISDMTQLYENVSSKADFNLGKFNLASFQDLKTNLPENYLIKGYFLEGKLIGFLSAMINNNMLDAHFVGINYQLNKTHAIYQRMLYDYITIAITKRLTCINFGRTASEIKSSIGAVPEDLTIYVRHKNSIPNKLFSLFLNKIEPTPFNQKKPFKNKNTITV